MEETVLLNIEHKVATVTINRERRRNSLDHVAMQTLQQRLVEGQEGLEVAVGHRLWIQCLP